VQCPTNDACESSAKVERFPYQFEGYSQLSTPLDSHFSGARCSIVTENSRGSWFRIDGESLCYSTSVSGSARDTIIAIHEGTDCGNLECLAQNLDSQNGTRGRRLQTFDNIANNKVSWVGENGTSYYIFVGGVPESRISYKIAIEVRSLVAESQRLIRL
jgi:hypothetical protein